MQMCAVCGLCAVWPVGCVQYGLWAVCGMACGVCAVWRVACVRYGVWAVCGMACGL